MGKTTTAKDDSSVVVDKDAPGPPISVPDTGDTGEGGKLKMIIQLVRKCFGVKDIAAMRLSLPASLLEPIPNLEYWHYLDRPDLFAAINDSHDPFDRMLAVLRFTFTKDLKFVHGKVCKPYNSVLGEHFRSHWDVIPVSYAPEPGEPPIPNHFTTAAATSTPIVMPSESSSIKSIKSIKSNKSTKSARSTLSFTSKDGKSPSTAATSIETNLDAEMSNLSLADGYDAEEDGLKDAKRVRVVYVTEQISHHPPVSAYFASCPARMIELSGIDQISAKVAATTLRVSPGVLNKGIFVRITGGPGEGEQYHITHPVASVNGILRGSFYVTVGESSIITCSGGKGQRQFRSIIEYKEESWLGKAHFRVDGIIHTYTGNEYKAWTKIEDVPKSLIVAVFDGSWRQRIRWRRVTTPSSAASSESDLTMTPGGDYATLLDLSTLKVIPKVVRPLDRQLPHESRKLWENVTNRLLKKEFGEATKEKVTIEQRQRDEAAERKKKGTEFVPRYFEKNVESGVPILTADGRKAVEEELQETSPYCIEGYDGVTLVP